MEDEIFTITVVVRDALGALNDLCRVFKEHDMHILDLNIGQYQIGTNQQMMLKVHGDAYNLNEVIDYLNKCEYVSNARFLTEDGIINYALVMFRLKAKVLLLDVNLQKALNKLEVEYIDFVDGYFVVMKFGSDAYIDKMTDNLIPFGIIDYTITRVPLQNKNKKMVFEI